MIRYGFLIFLFFNLLKNDATAQKQPLSYFLPTNINYDANIPTPEDFLGFQIGEWHVSHDQLLAYLRELDARSDRLRIEVHGRTFERRPLIIVYISAPKNHERLEDIRTQHLLLTDAEKSNSLNVAEMPVVLYQGYSIHGNEASGSNAAMLMAYYYAAAKGDEIENYLQNTVILFDPSFNPDGLQRFSTWVNQNKSKNLVSDPTSREFNETWPGGRFNHYWFDLNRDWLVSQMPESQGRVRLFQAWKPNILTDHHEMGSNSTFFFQPGVPSRVNPITPKKNQELTAKIGDFHAKALDQIGSAYYTKESFDDFYYGKGSTYPDAQGGVGILFEQASSRGHLQRTSNGPLSFAYTIRNQVTTSFSTLRAANVLRAELLDYQRTFFKNNSIDAKADKRGNFIFGEKNAQQKQYAFLQILKRNNIKVFDLDEDKTIDGKSFFKGNAYVVPLQQPQYRLIRGIFDTQKVFDDSLFYDISAWTLPMALDIPFGTADNVKIGKEITDSAKPKGNINGGKSSYAYVMEWSEYLAPNALNSLLDDGISIKVATQPFVAKIVGGENQSFSYGALMINVANQTRSSETLFRLLEEQAKQNGIRFHAIETGLTTEGIDLGSPNFLNIRTPKIALLVGNGSDASSIGEAWHLLDQRYDMQAAHFDSEQINRGSLSNYNVLVMGDGNFSQISDAGKAKIREWVSAGNTLIALGTATKWLKDNNLANLKFRNAKAVYKPNVRRAYGNADEDAGAEVLGGAIFEADLDLSHPLCYGYERSKLAVFQADTLFMEVAQNPYATPMQFSQKPLLSGYLHKKFEPVVKNAAATVVASMGNGKIICSTTSPNFRAFWYGTNKWFANAIFFGHLIQRNATEQRE
jgi:Zinc carboxypeptidase